jgi:UDP-3-O-[3-hydroxymyristoyl] glucosamine N-acyltransferase
MTGPDTPAIAATAVVHPQAKLGKGVRIGHGSIVHGNVELGDDTRVDEFCVVGHPTGRKMPPLRVGRGSLIRSYTILYEGSTYGDRLEAGHHAILRENTTAGTNLRAGIQCIIQGDCTFGDYVRLHSSIQVPKGSTLRDFVWVFPGAILTNDPLPPSDIEQGPTLDDGVVVCTGAIIMPGAHLGTGSFIAAGARVWGEVPPGKVVDGQRGEITGDVHRLVNLDHRIAHPWMTHFDRGYPPEAQERLRALRQRLQDEWKARRTGPPR